MDLSFNRRGPGEATVGIEVEALRGRMERPHARALPRPDVGTRLEITDAGGRAAFMERLEDTKSQGDIAVTIGICHLRIPYAFQA